MKHPVDLILPLAFLTGGLIVGESGRWYGVGTVLTVFLSGVALGGVARRAREERQP